MTRKLGRLLVVALVVAAVVAPMTVASADIGPQLTCAGIPYDADNPYHIVYPTDMNLHIRFFVDQWELWDVRHNGSTQVFDEGDLEPFLVFDMRDVSDVLGAPPAGGHYVFFWNDIDFSDYDYGYDLPFRIVGTPYDDIICGSPDDDVIRGLEGNDVLIGGSFYPAAGSDDDDIIQGGAGNDRIIGGFGGDGLQGSGGDDTMYAWWPGPESEDFMGPYPFLAAKDLGSHNEIFGNSGNDTIYTSTDFDMNGDGTITCGGPNPPDICANSSGDEAYGGPGNDKLVGGTKEDDLYGRGGDDTITGGGLILGGPGDYLIGGAGNDTIWGGLGADFVSGNAGNDALYAVDPTATGLAKVDFGDEIYGRAGDDMLIGAAGREAVMWGGDGNDTISTGLGLTNCGVVGGGSGADTITGGDDSNCLLGGTGDDTIMGGKGGDELHAGVGDDLVYGGADNDMIYGEAGYDDLFGDAGDDRIYGDFAAVVAGEGADWISGGDGEDIIFGGNGPDVLYGDAGPDHIWGAYYDASFVSGDAAADNMFGGLGSDQYFGKCTDLDKATEDTDPVADIDQAYNVAGLFLFTTYFEPGGVAC